MTAPTQDECMPLAYAVVAYEAERSEGRPGSAQFNAVMKLLATFPPERQVWWRMQLTTIRERYGN